MKVEIERWGEVEDQNLNTLYQINVAKFNWMFNITAAIEVLKNLIEMSLENCATIDQVDERIKSNEKNMVTADKLAEGLKVIDDNFGLHFNERKEQDYNVKINRLEVQIKGLKNQDSISAACNYDEAVNRIERNLDEDYVNIRNLQKRLENSGSNRRSHGNPRFSASSFSMQSSFKPKAPLFNNKNGE